MSKLFLILFLLLAGVAYSDTSLVGKPIPNFTVPILDDQNNTFSSTSICGHVVLLNLWASWCSACQSEHSVLMHIKDTTEVPIYGINYEDQQDHANTWLQRAGDPYVLNGIDANGSVADALGSYGLPETYVIDANGIVQYVFPGALTKETWDKILLPIVQHYIELAKKIPANCKRT